MLHPSVDGNCTVRLGLGIDQDSDRDEAKFKVLMPRDGSADSYGSFPCGREVGYDGKEFKFPKNYTCDSCTLQFEFSASEYKGG